MKPSAETLVVNVLAKRWTISWTSLLLYQVQTGLFATVHCAILVLYYVQNTEEGGSSGPLLEESVFARTLQKLNTKFNWEWLKGTCPHSPVLSLPFYISILHVLFWIAFSQIFAMFCFANVADLFHLIWSIGVLEFLKELPSAIQILSSGEVEVGSVDVSTIVFSVQVILTLVWSEVITIIVPSFVAAWLGGMEDQDGPECLELERVERALAPIDTSKPIAASLELDRQLSRVD